MTFYNFTKASQPQKIVLKRRTEDNYYDCEMIITTSLSDEQKKLVQVNGIVDIELNKLTFIESREKELWTLTELN